MRSGPRGPRRSVDRGVHSPAIEPRKSLILGADTVHMVEGNMSGRDSARPGRPGVVRGPGMCRRSLQREPGDLAIGRSAEAAGSASGRRGAVADDGRREKSDSAIVAWEADEQSDYGRSGAGGAKGGGPRGMRASKARARAQNRTNRVIGTGAHTVSRLQRLTVTHPRREPCAGIPLARI